MYLPFRCEKCGRFFFDLLNFDINNKEHQAKYERWCCRGTITAALLSKQVPSRLVLKPPKYP